MTFHVREAEEYDVSSIHALGSNAPELNVGGASGGFPSLEQIEDDIFESHWLVLENDRGHVWGFCCARQDDTDRRGGEGRSACVVYLFVEQRWRRLWLAKKLWDAMRVSLGAAGVIRVYTWAHPTSGVIEFFQKQGFAAGKPCVWMDCDLSGPLWEPTP